MPRARSLMIACFLKILTITIKFAVMDRRAIVNLGPTRREKKGPNQSGEQPHISRAHQKKGEPKGG